MKMWNKYFKAMCGALVCAVVFAGCPGRPDRSESAFTEAERAEKTEEERMKAARPELPGDTRGPEKGDSFEREEPEAEAKIVDADWSDFFGGLNGAAVIYDASDELYTVYNNECALTERPPCSTFKIISSLIALENGIIVPEDSVRSWSGEEFWNADWNKDIDYREAFRTSCVWYYRQVIDEIGKEEMQRRLDELQYGNCDISDWEGFMNTNSDNRALTGFWIESSLMISPKEQTEVMERIFGEHSVYSEETLEELRQVMLVSGQRKEDISIYGKTGTGKEKGVVVDAWFTGFAESMDGRIYFCVYLGRTDGMNVSGLLAKDIAIKIISGYASNR